MVQSGLVGHWPLHEASGRANDLSGNGNHGTKNGDPTQGVAGRSGLTATRFDGSGDYFDVTGLSLVDKATIAAWLKPEESGNDDDRSIAFRENNNIQFNHNNDGIMDFTVNNSATFARASAPYTVDQWEHWIGTYDGESMVLYKNGELVDTNFISGPMSGQGLGDAIGNQIGGSVNEFAGGIFDARFYNRALSPSEANHIYEIGSVDVATPPAEEDSAAVARYAFDDRSDPSTALDEWGANSGTISGATYNADSIRGLSMNFDGDDYVEVTNLSGSDLDIGNGSVTMSAWIKLNSASSFGYILDTSDGSANGAYSLASDNGTLGVILEDSTTAETENVDTGVWYHFVGVATSSGNSYAYLNGVRRGEDTWDGEFNTVDVLNIGRGVNDTTYVDSIIDDVRIYSRALSDYEVQQLYLWGTRGTDRRYEVLQQ